MPNPRYLGPDGDWYRQSVPFDLPEDSFGQWYVYVLADRNTGCHPGWRVPEANKENNILRRGTFTMELEPQPDLVAEDIAFDALVFSNEPFTVTWTDWNRDHQVDPPGAGPTNTGHWVDAVYLTPVKGGEDIFLGTVERDGDILQPGEFDDSLFVTARLPVDRWGEFNVRIEVDINNEISEFFDKLEDNNIVVVTEPSVDVTLLQPVDLEPTELIPPPSAVPGHEIEVTWSARNREAEPKTTLSWHDAIYLSADEFFDGPETDDLLGEFSHGTTDEDGAITLPPYTKTETVRIPNYAAEGDRYILVVVDAGESIFEGVVPDHGENDNVLPASILIDRTLWTDLTIAVNFDQEHQLPTVAAAGQTIDVSWQVTNSGTYVTPVSSWQDGAYFSTDDILDGDDVLATEPYTQELEADESYIVERSVSTPLVEASDYFLLFKTDVSNDVYEQEPAEDNNIVVVHPFTVTDDVADLVVDTVTVPPGTALSGQPLHVAWTVANIGTAPTRTGYWTDHIYLSTDNVLDPQDELLGALRYPVVLDPGSTIDLEGDFDLPIAADGSYYIIVETDALEQVFERRDDNNVGDATVEIDIYASDLTVTGYVEQHHIQSNEPLEVRWTVENTGPVTTNVGVWVDSVYLSVDDQLDMSADIHLASRTRPDYLDPGEFYPQGADVYVGIGFSGTYYLFIVTDADNDVVELNEDNNEFVKPMLVNIDLADAANLVVESVNAQDQVYAGQDISVSWTITNVGEGPTNVSSWRDAVYLSRDEFLDRPGDIFLGIYRHSGFLDVDTPRPVSPDPFPVPPTASGSYFVFVVTDSTNRVFELGREDDNDNYDPGASEIEPPTPADLAVTSVTPPPPPDSVLGKEALFQWEITNFGDVPVYGGWEDSLYLSSDDTWDISDTFVGRFPTNPGQLDPDPAPPVSRSVWAKVPGVTPGDYYVIVRSDVYNEIPETDEANNVGSSTGIFTVRAIPLQLDVEHPDTLANGQSRYYELPTPAGETVTITLDHSSPGAWTELYVRFGEVPTPGQFDFIFSDPGRPNQQITIPTTEEGTYYILAAATTGVTTPAASISTEIIPFGITSVEPTVVGAGEATVRLQGSRWTELTEFFLRKPGSDDLIAPQRTTVLDAISARATFDLANAALGQHDVIAQSADGSASAALISALTVEEALPSAVESEFAGPGAIRKGTSGNGSFIVRNVGNVDVAYTRVFLQTWADDNINVSLPDLDVDGLLGSPEAPNPFISLIAVGMAPNESRSLIYRIDVATSYGYDEVGIYADAYPMTHAEMRAFVLAQAEAGLEYLLAEGDLAPEIAELFEESFLDVVAATFDTYGFDVPSDAARAADDLSNEDLVALCGATTLALGYACVKTCALIPGGCGPACGVLVPYLGICCALPCSIVCPLYGSCECDPGQCAPPDRRCPSNVCCGVPGTMNCDDTPSPSDPNEKVGPLGFGPERSVGAHESSTYHVYFENVPDATAAAAEVVITDYIDPSLSLGSFRVGDIHFADMTIDVPEDRVWYQTTVDLVETHGVLLDIVAGVNAANREAFWRFQSIDPDTGEPTTDAYAGFLPPNDETGRGQGWVDYTISPAVDVTTGTVVTNSATIVFDVNEPIDTNEVFNTIDAEPPDSSVDPLPSEVADPSVPLTWSGSDPEGGSGLASYTIYTSLEGGTFVPVINASVDETSGTFENARGGGVYDFYSLATDNAGNTEEPPETPDATTTVAVQVPSEPTMGVPTAATVELANLGTANVSHVEHAVFEETTGQYVGTDGRLTDSESWQAASQWFGFVVRALDPMTEYSFKTKARSAPGAETEYGPATTVTTSIPGDVDGDGLVTQLDLDIVQEALGTEYDEIGFDPRADLNGDNEVTFADRGIVKLNFRRGDYNRDGYVGLDDYLTFQDCLGGPGSGGLSSECSQGDFDFDDDIDLVDVAALQREFGNGAN